MKANLKERKHSLDFGRFLAAFLVMIFHYLVHGNYGHLKSPDFEHKFEIFKYNFYSVWWFFLVSGYVITITARNRNAKQFFLARAQRLYPALWIWTTFLIIYGKLFPDTFYKYSIGEYLAMMTLLPDWFRTEYISD